MVEVDRFKEFSADHVELIYEYHNQLTSFKLLKRFRASPELVKNPPIETNTG
ncbi:MAG: hypothetical protein QXY50_04730 [Candidatus Caldarchaeum sp.]